MENMDYQRQATDFLEKTGATLKVKFLKCAPYFDKDKESRDIYKCTIKRNNRSYSFKFGQSIIKSTGEGSNKPSAYDILTCLEKYEYVDFQDFCDNFGYSSDSISAKKLYKACQKQFNKLRSLFNENELEELREIQ